MGPETGINFSERAQMKRKAAAGDDAPDEAFDEEEATRQAKRMKSEELRAALEAAGVEDTEGNKPALVERLVAAKKRAAAGDNDDDEAAPAAFDEEDAMRLAKRMKVEELRAALEAVGEEDTEGTKPALVERLVAAQRAAAAPPATEEASEGFDAAAATSAAKRMKVEELRAALEAVGASTEGNKPTLVERLVKAQRGDDEAAPEPPKEEAAEEEPAQVTPEETPAEAPAPASQKPPEEDSDDDFAPKKTPWDEENPTPEATGQVLDPYILLKRDFPGRDDDLRQLGVEPTIARENKPFKLKKKPMSATTPEHVTMVPRTDGSSFSV